MIFRVKTSTGVLTALCLTAVATLASATTLQRLSFEELTDSSDAIVSGKVTRTWSAWDAGHRYIWTHYTVQVAATQKGAQAATIELSEPGGVAEGMGMTISGSVGYNVGDNVFVFAQRMPNGLVRTAGWGQGKYTVDAKGRLRGEGALKDVDYVDAKTGATGLKPLTSLDGLTLEEASLRVNARLRTTGQLKAGQSGKVQ